MLKLSATIQATNKYELMLALREILRSVDDGNTSGFDSNEDGDYKFSIEAQ